MNPRKRAERAQGHRKPLKLEVSSALVIVRPVPPMPAGLSKTMTSRWARWWRSPVARTVDMDRDGEAVERLFAKLELRDRMHKLALKRPFVTGSQGQPILNPAAREIDVLDAAILQLEREFGRTPKAAAQLGVTIGDLQKTVEDLNRDASDDRDEDPRAQATR
jgi:hypothetical protein